MTTSPLLPVRSLIRQTWQRYIQHWNQFIEVSWWFLAIPLLSLIAVFLATLPASHLSFTSIHWLVLILQGAEVVLGVWIGIRLIQLALAENLKEEQLLARDLRSGWQLFWPMVWITVLSSLAILGGFIALLFPGIWLVVGLTFSSIFLIDRNARGQQALVQSLALVKGRWWPVMWRLFASLVVFGILVSIAQSFLSTLIALLFNNETLNSINELTRASLFGNINSVEGLRAQAISYVITAIPQALFTPLFVISNVILYRSLEETR